MDSMDTADKKEEQLQIIPSIDVIIPVYKPDAKFSQLIERLVNQSIHPQNIYLLHTIEDASGNAERERLNHILEAFSDTKEEGFTGKIAVKEIKKQDFDHGGTRNYGASISDSEILIFITQDAVPADNQMIKNLIQPFVNPHVAAVYGRQLAMPKAGAIEKYTRQFNYPERSHIKSKSDLPVLGIKTYFCSNVCAAYRKKIYTSLGGFVTKTIFNEDMIMAANIINEGYSIAYSAKAMVYHSHIYTYRQQFKRNFDLAVSQQQYYHIFSSVKSENEGMKLVKKTLKHLIDTRKYYLIPDLILQSGFKYLGYKAGRNYEHLPVNIIKKISMNPTYWEKNDNLDKCLR